MVLPPEPHGFFVHGILLKCPGNLLPPRLGGMHRLDLVFQLGHFHFQKWPRVVRVVMLKMPSLSCQRTLPVVHNGDGGLQPRVPRSPIHTPVNALVSALDNPWTATDGYDNS